MVEMGSDDAGRLFEMEYARLECKSAGPLRRYDDSRRFRGMAGARRRRPVPGPMLDHGVNPVYVVIGIALDPWLAFAGANPDPASLHDERMYIEHTTKWLAQRYGNHPAVLGFAIGNETNLQSARGTDRYLDYWQYLNHLSAIAKRYAPDKITMTAFADYPSGETPMLLKPLVAFKKAADTHPGAPTIPVCVDKSGANPGPDCSSAHRRRAFPADIYALDVWGFNAYRKPETEDRGKLKTLDNRRPLH